jgi:hypothetical protein
MKMGLSAMQYTEGDSKLFPFGLSPKAAAEALRSLGDKIESGEICLESVRLVNLAQANAYAKTCLRLVLIEKHEEGRGSVERQPTKT